MDNRTILGHIFKMIGKALCDPTSELNRSIVLSNEQMEACVRLLKVASSPQTHIYYIGDLSMRYGVTDRTIRNWISLGVVPRGHKHDSGDNRDYWLSHDLYKIDRDLIDRGYVKESRIENIDKRFRRVIEQYMFA